MDVSLPPFQALLDSHRADVYRFLLATVGPNEADDCFQETWIAALRAYPRVRHGDNLRAWLLKIAQNKARDAHRARGRRALPVDEPPDRGAHDTGIAAAQADNPGLWARVRALPEKQRLAVVHRTVLDTGYAELAEVLDCSEEAARRNVHEGLKKLRRELGDG
jgi:RNA polymerase sigma factor (sigma-70 family)